MKRAPISWLLLGALTASATAAHAATTPPTLADNITSKIPPDIRALGNEVKDIANLFSRISSAVDVTKAVLSLLGIASFASTEQQEFDYLNQHLDAVASSLDWEIKELQKENRLQDMLADIMTANSSIRQGTSINPMGPIAVNTAQFASEAEAPIQFLRYYRSSVTNGRWRNVIADPPVSNGDVYDWRIGVPALMQLISLRLQAIALIDPNFLKDGSYGTELLSYRTTLMSHYAKMVAGVQCGEQRGLAVPAKSSTGTEWFQGSCADIYTGAAVNVDGAVTVSANPTAADNTAIATYETGSMTPALARAKRQVLASLPLFELQSMIDILYLYGNPIAKGDLTVAEGTIPLQGTGNYCLTLAVTPYDKVPSTWIYQCNGSSSQHLQFDRKTGQIKAAGTSQCLTIRGADPAPKATVDLEPCAGTGGIISDASRWTYDAERGIVQNALGTVLDVQWAAIQAGTPVWTYSRNGTVAQKWAAPIPTNGLFPFM